MSDKEGSLPDDSDSSNECSDYESILRCYICGDFFLNPRILPCGHTFCAPCLIQRRNEVERDWKKRNPLAHKRGECGTLNCPVPGCGYALKVMNLTRWAPKNRAASDAVAVLRKSQALQKAFSSFSSETSSYTGNPKSTGTKFHDEYSIHVYGTDIQTESRRLWLPLDAVKHEAYSKVSAGNRYGTDVTGTALSRRYPHEPRSKEDKHGQHNPQLEQVKKARDQRVACANGKKRDQLGVISLEYVASKRDTVDGYLGQSVCIFESILKHGFGLGKTKLVYFTQPYFHGWRSFMVMCGMHAIGELF